MSAACSTATSTTGACGASESPRTAQSLSNAKAAAFFVLRRKPPRWPVSRALESAGPFARPLGRRPDSGPRAPNVRKGKRRGIATADARESAGVLFGFEDVRGHLYVTAVRHAESEHDRTVLGIVPCREGLGPQFCQARAGLILFCVKNITYPITPSNADNSYLSKVVDRLAQTINHLL